MGLLGKLVPSQIAAEVTQGVATVTADMMTPEEWAKQWAERMVQWVTRLPHPLYLLICTSDNMAP